MTDAELDNFVAAIKKGIYGAGKIARTKQGAVSDTGKNIQRMERDDDLSQRRRAAKTAVDEEVQEFLLTSLSGIIDPNSFYLDAEEDTPSKTIFSKTPTNYLIVIDPIDGTLEYSDGLESYSVNFGLFEKGKLLTGFIYFPSRGELYYYKDKIIYREKNQTAEKISQAVKADKNIAYVNNRVSPAIRNCLRQNGYSIIDDTISFSLWSDAFLQCIRGEIRACIFHMPQIRDVLMGIMLSNLPNNRMCDWKGNEIRLQDGGRIPRLLFEIDPVDEKIYSCLEE